MFLFLLGNPWPAHNTGYCCSCTFLYIIDDLRPSRQHQYTSHIDYHTVRGLRSLNFPFLNRNNSLPSNKNSRRSKFAILINILQRTKRSPAIEDSDSLKLLTLLPYPPLQPPLNLAALEVFGLANILVIYFLKSLVLRKVKIPNDTFGGIPWSNCPFWFFDLLEGEKSSRYNWLSYEEFVRFLPPEWCLLHPIHPAYPKCHEHTFLCLGLCTRCPPTSQVTSRTFHLHLSLGPSYSSFWPQFRQHPFQNPSFS